MLFELLDNLKKSEYEVKPFPYYSPARRGAAAALINTAIHILEDEAVTHYEVANVRNRLIDYMKEHPAVDARDVENTIEDTKVLLADSILDFHQEREKAILEDGEEYMTEEEMDAILEEVERGVRVVSVDEIVSLDEDQDESVMAIKEAFEVEAEPDGTIVGMKIHTNRAISNVQVNEKDATVTIKFQRREDN